MTYGLRLPALSEISVFALLFFGLTHGAQAEEIPYRRFGTYDGLPGGHVTALAQTSNGLLWVGTENGLAVYDGRAFRTISVPDSVRGIIESIQSTPGGSVWVGMSLGTVLKVHPHGVGRVLQLAKSAATLSRVLVRDESTVFVTTRAVWTLPTGAKRPTRQPLRYEVRPPGETAGASQVGSGARDAALGPRGQIWILDGRRGPGRFHPNGSVTFVGGPAVVSRRQGRGWNEIRFTGSGPALLVRGSRLYRFYPADQDIDIVLDTLESANLDLQGGVAYLPQSRRVLRYDVSARQMREDLGPGVGLPDAALACVLRGQDGGLWIGTQSGLLHLMAPRTRHLKSMGGPPLRYVLRFLREGNTLWVTTWGNGLVQLRPHRQRVTPGGRKKWIALPGRDGFLHALPTPGEDWYRWRPSAGWERFTSAGKAVRGFVDSSGTGFLWHNDGVYRHSSTGTATQRSFTRYTNLEPGTYRFEVRARLADAPPGPPATYAFTIPPHFYETWWFQLLVGLGGVGLGIGAYRWRTHRLRRRQEELASAVEARTEALRERSRELAEEKRRTEKQAERLAELDEAKNRFFAHVSHEFRTPLSLILTPLEEAVQNATEGIVSLGVEQVRRMVRNGRRLQRLIEQLLDLATLEAGRMDLNRQPGDLAGFVCRTVEAFASKAEQNGIDLQLHTASPSLETRFDSDKVESIVGNLLSNALKFTPEGGRVSVWVGRREAPGSTADGGAEKAVIEVADTGPGMDAQTQERIFERFEHVDPTTAREHEGAGLGLTLTRELVELHSGTIEVESTPGEGTTFTVTLPLLPVSDTEQMPADSADHPALASLEPKLPLEPPGDATAAEERGERGPAPDPDSPRDTVLVVEDNAEMRAYLREELSEQWIALEAEEGAEGWEKVQSEEPDLVLSDVMMPGVDGFELCERVKGDPDLRTIPVILLTACSESEAAVEGLDCGADDYLAKPFDVEELKQRIANHLTARGHLCNQYQQEVHVEALDLVVEEQYVPFLETITETVAAHLSDPELSHVDDCASLFCRHVEAEAARAPLTRGGRRPPAESPFGRRSSISFLPAHQTSNPSHV